MASTSRESRRRRILEAGSDRLAFITGQIRELSSSSQSPSKRPTLSSPPTASRDQVLLNQPTEYPGNDHEKAGPSVHEKNQTENVEEIDSETSSNLHFPGVGQEISKAPASDSSDKTRHTPASPTYETSSLSHSSAEKPLETLTDLQKAFTLDQVTAAITTSEHLRLLCSITLACLVVSSCLGSPELLGRSILTGIIGSRPVLLLLLTNLTMILCQLLLNKHGDSSNNNRGDDGAPSTSGADLVEQVGNALEIVLLMQRVMDAVFMDFGIYAVIVVCGLSFA